MQEPYQRIKHSIVSLLNTNSDIKSNNSTLLYYSCARYVQLMANQKRLSSASYTERTLDRYIKYIFYKKIDLVTYKNRIYYRLTEDVIVSLSLK